VFGGLRYEWGEAEPEDDTITDRSANDEDFTSRDGWPHGSSMATFELSYRGPAEAVKRMFCDIRGIEPDDPDNAELAVLMEDDVSFESLRVNRCPLSRTVGVKSSDCSILGRTGSVKRADCSILGRTIGTKRARGGSGEGEKEGKQDMFCHNFTDGAILYAHLNKGERLMTQYQQVLTALKKIGGKGTMDEIFKAVDGIDKWATKTKKASVASYLSTSEETTKEGDVWVSQDNKAPQNDGSKSKPDNDIERGLYFITLNPNVTLTVPGLLFKIGKSDHANNRLQSYSASLPYNPIQELGFYRIPADVDLFEAEKQVRGELLGNDSLGFRVERFFGNHQDEWLQILDWTLSKEKINILAIKVNEIVQTTIDNLRKLSEGDDNGN
jgi:hypothetical protein